MRIKNSISNVLSISFVALLFLFAFTWIIFDFNGSSSSLKDTWSIVSSFFGGLTTLVAAYIASLLYNDWRDQENEVFKRNLAYNIYNDMSDLLFMLLVMNQKYNIDDLQLKFHKINMDLLLYSKKEHLIKPIIKEFSYIYLKQISIYETNKKNNKIQKIEEVSDLINKYGTVLHTVANFVGIEVSAETIQNELNLMLKILNESNSKWVSEETNNIINTAMASK